MRTAQFQRIGLLATLVAATAGSGCASMSNTDKGAVGGGVIGAAAGTAIGAATHHPLLGAVVGGLGGTAVGALAGNEADKDEARKREAIQAAQLAQAQAQQQRLGVGDVIQMTQSGQNETVIINQIRLTHSTFQLTTSDLDVLKKSGVTDRVIAEMQNARPAPGVVVQQPVVYDSSGVIVQPNPVVVVRPYPYYGYGYGYGYRRGW